jgi:hypothetical protein
MKGDTFFVLRCSFPNFLIFSAAADQIPENAQKFLPHFGLNKCKKVFVAMTPKFSSSILAWKSGTKKKRLLDNSKL